MNPGKVVDPYRLDENLRLGTTYRPPKLATHFRYPGDDKESFSRAVLRCVGVGQCRRVTTGTMCPSYMATLEEKHSTRGRARLLFEMLQGEVITDGWRSEEVKEALDLCLACKGCKRECPVNVDMATYKAEFLSHYYSRRLRPRHAYFFGLIGRWAHLAESSPRLANLFTQTPGLRAIAKRAIGIAPQRSIPAFASTSFREWFTRRAARRTEGARVLLWPDTFNNYFLPQTARAAVGVLEHAGYVVHVPKQRLCCGRPLYDYGMLATAKRWLRRVLDTLRPEIEAGVPLVGLEPTCVAVFRDELMNLFPDDRLAAQLSKQSFLLSEFLVRYPTDALARRLPRKALVHGHCHHRAVMTITDEMSVLQTLEIDAELLDSGCCGMAGAFGFEKEHYDVSMKCGERVLLPAVRSAPADSLIIADGFSCREQISQSTGRRALHLAEVLELALREGVPNGRTFLRRRAADAIADADTDRAGAHAGCGG